MDHRSQPSNGNSVLGAPRSIIILGGATVLGHGTSTSPLASVKLGSRGIRSDPAKLPMIDGILELARLHASLPSNASWYPAYTYAGDRLDVRTDNRGFESDLGGDGPGTASGGLRAMAGSCGAEMHKSGLGLMSPVCYSEREVEK